MAVCVYSIDQGTGLVMEVDGFLAGDEFLAAHRQFWRFNRKFKSCKFWFTDYQFVTGTDLNSDHAKELTNINMNGARQNPKLVLATHAQSDIEFGMTRMWQTLAQDTGWHIKPFREREGAMRWVEAMINQPINWSQRERLFRYPPDKE